VTTKRRRIAPATRDENARAKSARRAAELRAILRLRGPAFDRTSLSKERREELDRTPYGRAASAYLLTHDKYAWDVAESVDARHIPIADLVQAARFGLMQALDRFDEKRLASGTVTSFLSYAKWWVRCEVGKLLEREGLVHVPSTTRKAAVDLRVAIGRHAAELGRDAEWLTDAEALEAWSRFGPRSKRTQRPAAMRLDRCRELRAVYLGHDHAEVSTTAGHVSDDRAATDANGHDRVVTEVLGRVADETEDRQLEVARGALLDEAVASLPPLHRRVVAEEFGAEPDAEAASVPLPESHFSVAQILKAAFARIRLFVADREAELGLDLDLSTA